MSCRYIRFVSAGLALISVLAVAGIAYPQRAAESARPSSSEINPGEAIVPFKIQVPDAVLSDLKRRLAQGRFADEFPDAGWDYGTNLAYLKSLVEYWLSYLACAGIKEVDLLVNDRPECVHAASPPCYPERRAG